MFSFDKKYLKEITQRLAHIEDAMGIGPSPKVQRQSMLERVAYERNPEFAVHKIDNGFLAITNNAQAMRVSMVYCKDAKELADHIIASSARKKLNVPEQAPEQLDLFSTPKEMRITGGSSFASSTAATKNPF